MALRRIGSKLVAEGASEYLSMMGKAATANTQFGKSGEQAAAGIDKMNVRTIAAGTAIGGIFASAVQKGVAALTGFVQSSTSAIVQHERLSQSMTSLVAKELMTAGATDDMTKALGMAAPRAQELLKWIQELAIKSPFDQQGVAEAFRMALAYGFTSTEAQRLTAATIDFSTATGASSDVMARMSLALGQVKARGKLMGGEILQLVSAGVNVNAILKEMGFTMQDVATGAIEAGAFIEAFTKTLERDFGGAASRSAETLGGLLNTMGDIREMSQRALFQPIVQALLPALTAITNKMQEFIPTLERVGYAAGEFTKMLMENKGAILQVVAVIGAMVGGYLLVTTVIPAVIGLVSTLTAGLGALISGGLLAMIGPVGLVAGAVAVLGGAFAAIGLSVKKFRESEAAVLAASTADLEDHMLQRAAVARAGEQRRLEAMGEMGDKILQQQAQQNQQISNDSRSWGENIVIQFAQGMANAIAAVVSVLIQIGQVIASWLAPGSPPRILPDIDKWGTSAMQEYVDGMTAVDFGMFNDLTSKIGGFLRSIPGLERSNVVDNMINIRQAVMGLVEEFNRTGSIGEGSFAEIERWIGGTENNVREYIQALVEAQAAQDNLNSVTEHYQSLLNPMRDQLRGLQKQRQDYINNKRREELQNIITRATASGDTDAVFLAQLELQEMAIQDQIAATEEQEQAAVDAAQAEVDAANERLAMQEALLAAQTENNNLIREQLELLRGGGGGGGAGGIGGAAGGLASAIEGIQAALAPGGGLGAAMDGFKDRITGLIEEIKAPFAGLGTDLLLLGQTWDTVFSGAGEKLDGFMQNMWAKLGPGGEYPGIMEAATGIMVEQWGAGGTWHQNVELMKLAVELFVERWNEIWGDGGVYDSIMTFATDKIDEIWGENGVWESNMKLMSEAVKLLQEKWNENMDLIRDKLSQAKQWVQDLWDKIVAFKDWLLGNLLKISIDWSDLPEWMQPNSPYMRLQGRFMMLEDYLNRATFQPQLAAPIMPPATTAGASRTYNNTYNQQQVQGIGSATISNGMDLATLEAVIRRVVGDAIDGR